MSGISLVLWLIIGRGIFRIGRIVGIDKIMISLIEPFKRCYQFRPLIPLAQQPYSEHNENIC